MIMTLIIRKSSYFQRILCICAILLAISFTSLAQLFYLKNFEDQNNKALLLEPAIVNQQPTFEEDSELKTLTKENTPTNEYKAGDEWENKWKNTKLPNFKLKNLQGEIVSNANLKNKITVINFWFIGCKPCVNEIPDLNELVEKYKNEPICFLAPSFDNKNSLKKFIETKSFNYTILAEATEFIDKMDIYAYPTHLVIDKNGIIKEIIVGGPDIPSRLDLMIQKLIASEK